MLWTFCYHDVDDYSFDNYKTSHTISMDQIWNDIRIAESAGLEIIERRTDYLRLFSRNISQNAVLLTFDDGYLSQVHALSELSSSGKTGGILFVVVGQVGRAGFADWSALRDLSKEGYSIQSHGYSHRVLTLLDDRSLMEELVRSREEIEQQIGQPVWGLSLPQGFYNVRVLRAAKCAGYRVVFTSRYGTGFGFHRKSAITFVNRIVARGSRIPVAISSLREDTLKARLLQCSGAWQDAAKNLIGYRLMHLLWMFVHSRG